MVGIPFSVCGSSQASGQGPWLYGGSVPLKRPAVLRERMFKKHTHQKTIKLLTIQQPGGEQPQPQWGIENLEFVGVVGIATAVQFCILGKGVGKVHTFLGYSQAFRDA